MLAVLPARMSLLLLELLVAVSCSSSSSWLLLLLLAVEIPFGRVRCRIPVAANSKGKDD